MRRRQVAQTVSHVMLDHMSSSGVMRGDGRQRGEERVKHEIKEKNVVARYRNNNLAIHVATTCNTMTRWMIMIWH